MSSALIQLLRSRWFAWAVHAGLWLLLYLVASDFGGRAPDFRDSTASSAPAESPAPVADLGALFATARWPKPLAGTNSVEPFYTLYFVPKPSPTPPPPTTLKLQFTYQGFYQTGDNPKNAVVKVADSFVIARVGAPLATNLFIADAAMRTLTLTNAAAQTNLLLLNVQKEIEVPLK